MSSPPFWSVRRSLAATLGLVAWCAASTGTAAPLERDWCTGVSPVSWGFSVTPPTACREIRLTVASRGVEVLAARGGPGLPATWAVELEGPRVIVAAGTEPLTAETRLASFVVVETNRSSADVSRQGVHPVVWEARFAVAAGQEDGPSVQASFEPVLELSDAVSRGIVLATVEPLSPLGPAEVTVDNPTWKPVWLDLEPGSIVRVGGQDWVVGLTRPFRMMQKQKTGRTVDLFPLSPSTDAEPPRRLRFAVHPGGDSPAAAEIALAVQRVRALSTTDGRRPGSFEAFQPFEFWPLLLKWAVWQETGEPDRELLLSLVREVIERQAAAGDPMADQLDPAAAAGEIEGLLPSVRAARSQLAASVLPVALEASRQRFN